MFSVELTKRPLYTRILLRMHNQRHITAKLLLEFVTTSVIFVTVHSMFVNIRIKMRPKHCYLLHNWRKYNERGLVRRWYIWRRRGFQIRWAHINDICNFISNLLLNLPEWVSLEVQNCGKSLIAGRRQLVQTRNKILPSLSKRFDLYISNFSNNTNTNCIHIYLFIL